MFTPYFMSSVQSHINKHHTGIWESTADRNLFSPKILSLMAPGQKRGIIMKSVLSSVSWVSRMNSVERFPVQAGRGSPKTQSRISKEM